MLYPRKVEIHRLRTVAGPGTSPTDVIGLTGYSGAEASTDPADPQGEAILYKDIPANIQAAATGRKRDSALPQDAVSNPTWDIFLPLTAAPRGAIRDRDIVVDDEDYRYEVGQAYWNILGWKLMCIRLEV
ncbi:hypothetical protein ACRQ5Q_15125 [Bradyrhizobium sp. PMVTL-01]|uniref:hypothetical protein n=1 Tax=Bradyrhizobium sp. PMVTL-01 TaxID=3434999 RepID=UPI003F6EE1D0